MTTIRITTDRLPQPDRRKGAVLEVTPEKAASMAAQGFAEIISETPSPARSSTAPVPAEPKPAPEAPAAAQDAPAAAPAAAPLRRRRVGGAL